MSLPPLPLYARMCHCNHSTLCMLDQRAGFTFLERNSMRKHPSMLHTCKQLVLLQCSNLSLSPGRCAVMEPSADFFVKYKLF
jgi:hypothetical protein